MAIGYVQCGMPDNKMLQLRRIVGQTRRKMSAAIPAHTAATPRAGPRICKGKAFMARSLLFRPRLKQVLLGAGAAGTHRRGTFADRGFASPWELRRGRRRQGSLGSGGKEIRRQGSHDGI